MTFETLKLVVYAACQVPSYSVGMRVSFDSIGEASAVVQETLAAGIQVNNS
jgi:hypothetical protein